MHTPTSGPIDGIDVSDVTTVPLAGLRTQGASSREVRSPYDDTVLGRVPVLDEGDVHAAVTFARQTLDETAFHRSQRAQVLDRAVDLLIERHEQFARCIALEAAKPISTARAEVSRAVDTFRFSAAVARTASTETVPLDATPAGEGKIGFLLSVPVGVVGAIAPFNFPLNLVAHKVAPAIAAGCPVVLKPAEQTPFSSILLARLLIEECGLPEGYLQVVTGKGSSVGAALVRHPDVAMITFTGSPEVGWGIRAQAPRKKVGLELGNNAPLIIEADGDWCDAIAKVRTAGFSHAGQSCVSTQRLLVHQDIAQEVTKALAEAVSSLVVGDPLDEETEVSALISTAERDRVAGWIAEAESDGGRVVTGGFVNDAGVLVPTVIADARPTMKVCSNEVFGPVVAITTYATFDEAIALANDTKYGLQAGVYTSDISKALTAARRIDFGGVLINEVPTWRADHQPYGGLRDSGNTKEGPAWAYREMSEERLIVLNSTPA